MKKTALVIIITILFMHTMSSLSAQQRYNSLLTNDELLWLNENRNLLRYAPNPSWPPGDFVEDGIHKGFTADYIDYFEKQIGFEFEKVYFNTWSEIIDGLQNDKADFVGSIHQSDDRDQYLLFSEPFMTVPLVIIVQSGHFRNLSEQQINKMTLACAKNYSSRDYIRSAFPEALIDETNGDLSALLKTSLGGVDGAVVDLMTASYLVHKYGITNLELGTRLDFSWHLRFACKKDKAQLIPIINKLLSSMSAEEREAIYHRWVHIIHDPNAGFFERNKAAIMITALITLIAMIAVSIFIFTLKKLVKRQTLELEKAKAEALEKEKQYRLLIENQTDLVVKADNQGRLLYVSPSYCRMFGKSESALVGKSFMPLVHEDDRQATQEAMLSLNDEPYSCTVEQRVYTTTGWRWISWSDNAILDEEQNVIEIIGVGRDITDRKMSDEIIKKSLQEKQTLLRELYHRTKNNMQVIISMISLHSMNSKNQKLKDILSDIVHQIMAMSLVHEKLYRSRNLSSVDFSEYVVELFDAIIASRGIDPARIKLESAMATGQFLIDTAIPCGLVICELMTNSLKHAFPDDRSGTITISARKMRDKQFFLRYADNGVGIRQNNQIDGDTKMGLEIVKMIVQHQLQGTLNIINENGLIYEITFADNIYSERVKPDTSPAPSRSQSDQ